MSHRSEAVEFAGLLLPTAGEAMTRSLFETVILSRLLYPTQLNLSKF
jgi:hypothetical protein